MAVAGSGTNAYPVVQSTPPEKVRLGNTYFYIIDAIDPNGDPITFNLDTAPAGMTIGLVDPAEQINDSANLIRWTPTAEQIGPNAMSVRIDDGQGGFVVQSVTIGVVTGTVNEPPRVTSTPAFFAEVNQPYEYNIQAQDPEGDQLFFSLTRQSVGMSLDEREGTLRWTPNESQVGEHQVELEVLDTQGSFVGQSFTISVRPVNVPPQISSTPSTEATVDQIYAYAVGAADPNGDRLTFSLDGAPEGMIINPFNGLVVWRPESTQEGINSVSVRVEDDRGGFATQEYQIDVLRDGVNEPPLVTSTPSFVAIVGTQYTYQATGSDPDEDALTFLLDSPPAGMTINATTGLLEWTPTAGQVGTQQVRVLVEDVFGARGGQYYPVQVRGMNNAPQITSTPVLFATPGAQYGYDVFATDADNDTITTSLDIAPNGMTVDRFGRIIWTPTEADLGSHDVTLTVSDSLGSSTQQSYAIQVEADSDAPLVDIFFDPIQPTIGTEVHVIVSVTDDVGVEQTELTVDGQPIPLDGVGRAQFIADKIGPILVAVSAIDKAGNTTEETETLSVIDPDIVGDPIVEIIAPGFDETITAPVDIIGTANDPDLDFYTIEIGTFEGEFFEIARGTTPVVNGVLGQLDPSLLLNEQYFIRLHAVDLGGNDAEVQQIVQVVGNLKVGNLSLAFTDLSVPVSGVPITLTRTYDTLNADREDDFGFGWRLEIKDTDLRSTVPTTADLEDYGIFNPYSFGDKVYVTVPGRGREGFTFEPRPMPGFGARLMGFWEPHFKPDVGTTSELTVEHNILLELSGQFFLYAGRFPYNPASSFSGGSFTLTTDDGLRYDIDGRSGDARLIADRNGNTVRFESRRISSSSGQEIQFERDARGRIAAVIDPTGQRIEYQYDANGDLTTVTDRANNTTQFTYREDFPHYLEEVIDPLGRRGAKSVYDENGKLVQLIDAGGKTIELIHDPDNFIERVQDRLGNVTLYEYDTLGNIVTEIDPEGGLTRREYSDLNNPLLETAITKVLTDGTELTTTFTYDRRGNKLSETDPLGNTTRFTYDSRRNVLSETDAFGLTTTTAYNSAGNPTSTVDPFGVTSTIAYSGSGNPTKVVLGSNTTTYEHDSFGNITRENESEGADRTYTYDENGNRLSETVSYTTPTGVSTVVTTNAYDAENRLLNTRVEQDGTKLSETTFIYDAVGNKIEEIDGLNRITKFLYDDLNNLIETIFPDETPADDSDNPRLINDYDAEGRLIARTDEGGRTTQFVYDKVDRLVETVYPDDTPAIATDNPRTRKEYDLAGRQVAAIDERGNRTEFRYDLAGNLIATIFPDATPTDLNDNPKTTNQYDTGGRRVASTDQLGNTTRFVYAGARLVESILPDNTPEDLSDNPRFSNTHTAQGLLESRTDAEGNSTRYEYDTVGRVTVVIQSVAGKDLRTEYTYDELSNLVTQKDANGHVSKFEYDGLGRKTATELPLGQRSITTYNLVGKVESTTDFNGDTITFDYDSRDRMISKNLPSSSISFSYTPSGQRASVTDSRGVTTYQYDVLDRLLSRLDPDGASVTYTYDDSGNVTNLTTEINGTSRTVASTFDERNRLKTVADANGMTTYTYDAVSNLIYTQLPNGTVESRDYDEQSRLTLVETKNDVTDQVLARFDYELDRVGNRIAIDEHDGRRVEFEYDDLYRLTTERIHDPGATSATRTIDYTYDNVGNRLSRNDSAEGISSYTYDDNDRLIQELAQGVPTNYTYDDNGNVLSKSIATDSVFYGWDAEGRLISADTDGDGTDDVQYQYDADGNRVSQISGGDQTLYLLDTNVQLAQVLEEFTPGGVIKVSYTFGNNRISQNRGGLGSFYHVDGLGSTRVLTDVSGAVTDRYIYDAFGRSLQVIGTTENSILFAGEQRDLDLGFDFLRARYLDPATGRFTSRDPFAGSIYLPTSLHDYLYANQNPVNFTDPSGQFSLAGLSVSVGISSILSSIAIPILFGVATATIVVKVIGPGFQGRAAGLLLISSGTNTGIERGFKIYRASNNLIAIGTHAIQITKAAFDFAAAFGGAAGAINGLATATGKAQTIAQAANLLLVADDLKSKTNDFVDTINKKKKSDPKPVEDSIKSFTTLALGILSAVE